MAKNIEHSFRALKLDGVAPTSVLALMEDPPEVGSVFLARATHIVDPHNFYLLPLRNEKILPYIEQPGPRFSKFDIKSGIIVIYKKNNDFKRGLIREITGNKCKMFAIDRGYEDDDVDLKNIFRPLIEEACLAPPLASLCQLYLCEPRGPVFSEEAINAFKEFMGEPNEKLRIEVKSMSPVKMTVLLQNSYNDVATLLALTEFTQMVKVVPQPKKRPGASQSNTFMWKHQTLNIGQTLTVRIQHGVSFSELYVSTVEDYKDYCRKRADFGSYCRCQDEISDSDFKLGAPVGVMTEDHSIFERAVIERILIPKQEAQVRLVDWGKVITVKKNKVRLLPTELYSIDPVRAFYCSALNGQDFVKKLPATLCKGYMYKMTIKTLGSEFDKPYMVTLASAM